MCLYTTNSKIRTAKKDIICYKIVVKERKRGIFRIFHKPMYRAPFYDYYTYRLKERYYLGKSLLHGFDVDSDSYVVYEGFHSFADIQDAKRMLSEWSGARCSKTIVQCVIPKGAEYIKGTIDHSPNSPTSYVSDEIICVKEV